jgi:hypothetical protein
VTKLQEHPTLTRGNTYLAETWINSKREMESMFKGAGK